MKYASVCQSASIYCEGPSSLAILWFINKLDRSAMDMLSSVKNNQCNLNQEKDSPIAPSLDGAMIMISPLKELQALLKEVFPHVHFVHFYAETEGNDPARTFCALLSANARKCFRTCILCTASRYARSI